MNTEKWIQQIDEITEQFQSNFGHLSADELNEKPHATVWSIAQNIHHLIVINSTYYPIIDQVKKGNYTLHWISKLGFMVRFFGNVVLNSVQPDRRKKMKTFPLWEPSASVIPGDILEQFKAAQEKLKETIRSCSELLAKGTLISSPANKVIVYKLETAFDIIVTHERRHLEQAKELLKQRH